MRAAVHEYFTPQAMESWRPFVRRPSPSSSTRSSRRAGWTSSRRWPRPLPVRVITQMMGVPEEDRDHLRHLADKLLYINRGEPDRMRHLMEGIEG